MGRNFQPQNKDKSATLHELFKKEKSNIFSYYLFAVVKILSNVVKKEILVNIQNIDMNETAGDIFES